MKFETMPDNFLNWQTIFENAPIGVFQSTPEGKLIYANTAIAEKLGYASPAELIQTVNKTSLAALYEDPTDRPMVVDQVAKAGGTWKTFEVRFRGKAGGVLDAILSSGEHAGPDGMRIFCGFVRDVTERKRAEQALRKTVTELKGAQEALRASEERFRNLAQLLPAMVYETDLRGRLTFVNQFGLEMSGYTWEDFEKGFNCVDFIAPEDQERVKAKIMGIYKGEFNVPHEYTALRKDGRRIPVIAQSVAIMKDGGPAGLRGVFFDISERKKAEDALRNAQKLESLGVLAGGIAHDFNNLLSGIYANINAAQNAEYGDVSRFLSTSMQTIQRARALTHQLLTFAKGGDPVISTQKLFPFVREMAEFALSGSNVSCECNLQSGLWACNFDKHQLGQAIDNIVINAKQAMPGGGTIDISAANIAMGEKQHPVLGAGKYVRISIRDGGIGIPKEILSCIFDPFYTTKAAGHGLGLATSFSIIKRHGGHIDVESEYGRGSTFHVYIPAAPDTPPVEEETDAPSHKGTGTFLVMDDEDVVRDAIKRALESLGYSVVSTRDGKETLDFFKAEIGVGKKIAGMILDLTIPGGTGGRDVVTEIRKLDAKIPVFVTTGYADDAVIAKPSDYGFTAALKKPFTWSDLIEILSRHM